MIKVDYIDHAHRFVSGATLADSIFMSANCYSDSREETTHEIAKKNSRVLSKIMSMLHDRKIISDIEVEGLFDLVDGVRSDFKIVKT